MLFRSPNFKWGASNGDIGNAPRRLPYPPIVTNPTFRHVIHNWNMADTGLLLTVIIGSAFLARIHCKYGRGATVSQEKQVYFLFFNIYLSLSVYLGMQNSYYRLLGFKPNGLNWEEEVEPELKKYDFSSDFVKNSIWKHFYEK